MAKAQIISHYGDNGVSGANMVGFYLTVNSPISQKTYVSTLPLNIKIDWNPVGVSQFWPFAGLYTYSIDNKPAVSIVSNQSSNTGFNYHPTFSYLLDVSNLTNGKHSMVISAGLYFNNSGQLMAQLCNQSSTPIFFIVQNSTVQTSPTVPEIPTLIILPIFALATLLSIVLISPLKCLAKSRASPLIRVSISCCVPTFILGILTFERKQLFSLDFTLKALEEANC
jgi:hypothetical protein